MERNYTCTSCGGHVRTPRRIEDPASVRAVHEASCPGVRKVGK